MPFYEFAGHRPLVSLEAFVHPEAVLIGAVTISSGCYIGAGAVLRADIGSIRVGRGSNIQETCVLHSFPDKEVLVHPEVHVGHGCILHGCEICSQVLVGMGAIIGDGVKINSHCLIGAGSFVPLGMEIPPNRLVLGSPARIIRALSLEQKEQITAGLALYQGLTQRYLKDFRRIS
jgi:phenylacetic acid degradation protein